MLGAQIEKGRQLSLAPFTGCVANYLLVLAQLKQDDLQLLARQSTSLLARPPPKLVVV